MNTEEKARELLAQQRQQDEHLQQSMLNRAETEVHNAHHAEIIEEEARESMSRHRRHEEHLHESMLERAETEIGMSHSSDDDMTSSSVKK